VEVPFPPGEDLPGSKAKRRAGSRNCVLCRKEGTSRLGGRAHAYARGSRSDRAKQKQGMGREKSGDVVQWGERILQYEFE